METSLYLRNSRSYPQTQVSRYMIVGLNESSPNQMLGLVIAMGRGRRLAITESGRLSLVPAFGSQAISGAEKGSPFVILHGCIVPLVLDRVDEKLQDYRVVGDAYAEDIMYREVVTGEKSRADEFILI